MVFNQKFDVTNEQGLQTVYAMRGVEAHMLKVFMPMLAEITDASLEEGVVRICTFNPNSDENMMVSSEPTVMRLPIDALADFGAAKAEELLGKQLIAYRNAAGVYAVGISKSG